VKYYSIRLITFLIILSVVFISGCKKNRPPHPPYTPSGPSVGAINKKYNFSSLAIDPDGDNITMRFDWGNGDTSVWLSDLAEIWVASEQTVSRSHSWSVPDTYYVRAQAKDKKENISEWSMSHCLVIAFNLPPNAPSISGPSIGSIFVPYTFCSTTADPDSDKVAIRFDWCDGDTSDWSSWISCGDSIWMGYSWTHSGTYYVRTQAEDSGGLTSNWSLPHSIIMNELPTPSVPVGPSTGYIQTSYQFSSFVVHPDNKDVAIRFDWSNGEISEWSHWVSSGDSVSMSHYWFNPGTYYIKAQAKDSSGLMSPWSLPHSIILSQLPAPSIPSGPSTGYIQTSYQFSSFEIHPNGYNVAIRFDWGDGDTSVWSNLVSSGDSVRMNHSWFYPDTYYIRAQAKDSFGATSSWSLPYSIEIKNPARGLVWICAIDSAAWYPRESHASVVFNNKIWVAGGHYRTDEVWSSSDGINWTCETNSTGFGEREDYAMVVFDNKIWVLGGGYSYHPKNDVWCSADGVSWTCVTNSAQWTPRYEHTAAVFDNKMWVLGGNNRSLLLNDVWSSADGANWIRATRSAEWGIRSDHTSVVYDNKIWVIGGSTRNDVWYSTDGSNWSRTSVSAAWSGRIGHTSVVFDNKIWVIGGSDTSGPLNDVWYSTNGFDWIQETTQTIFSPRWDHTSVVFNNKIWVVGGAPPGLDGTNDVWYRDSIPEKRK
jgi:leucine-zipper-like transcriptional regulator 1